MALVEVKVPDIGDFKEVEVTDVRDFDFHERHALSPSCCYA